MNVLVLCWKIIRNGCCAVLPLDLKYTLMSKTELENLLTEYQVKELYYHPEVFDCDDYAWVFKGMASRKKLQAVGLVVGWRHGLHCWNIAVTREGIYWIEPQTGRYDLKGGYKPWLVII